MSSKGTALLAWVFFVHLTAIYLYTRGFLLTRLSLSEISSCPDGECTLQPTYKRAVVLIIDSLRFDFLTPDPPHPPSPHHHNVLTFPQELTASLPEHSLIFDAFSDPPTTTLQRIKGLTTGSLPTFVDMGSNFGGASIVEDSLLSQLRDAGKKVAFMGDDTWTTVFTADMFAPGLCFPYDSFNVEDLHTVDEGVIRHLFPLLSNDSAPWDVIIGHFLGVDHVGHRIGPDHPTMRAKLTQMDDVLRQVVSFLQDDTLLVVLGDHGMDRRGDHGGDGVLETSSGLWIYSKKPLTRGIAAIPPAFRHTRIFPDASVPHRSVQQIDLVPSLALLLGIPIPYNNLGMVIPELFSHDTRAETLGKALELNAQQVRLYLDTYRSSASGGELDSAWDEMQAQWAAVQAASTSEARWLAIEGYTRIALSACRSLWAQFNVTLIGLGLTLLGVGAMAGYVLFIKFGELHDDWIDWAGTMRWTCMWGMAVGSVAGFTLYFPLRSHLKGVDALDCVLFGAPLVSSLAVIATARPASFFFRPSSFSLPLLLHTLAFASNSFTIWEDHVVTFLLLSSAVPGALAGFAAPTARLRWRILGFSALFAACVRLMAISTVCREEQHPYCHATFFASASLPAPPLPMLICAVPSALVLPYAVRRILRISKSDNGLAAIMLPWLLPAVLLQGCAFWILEHLETSEVFGPGYEWILRPGRTLLARCAMGSVILFGVAVWWQVPLCLAISSSAKNDETKDAPANVDSDGKPKTQVTILGFANAFGSSYLILWCLVLGFLYPATQLTGQVVLGLAMIAMLAHVEVTDSVRDVRALEAAFASSTPSSALDADTKRGTTVTFAEIVPVALLALHAFHGTGHQSTIPSIQWKSAFVLTSSLTYPFSPALVVLNAFGPQFLMAFAAPLLALWNVAPLPQPTAGVGVGGGAVRAGLGMMLYHSTLLFGSAVSSAWLRRHLMVWKVFAPRYMSAAASLVAVDLAIVVGVGIGVPRITGQRPLPKSLSFSPPPVARSMPTSNLQLPHLVSFCKSFELRTHRQCRSVSAASRKWALDCNFLDEDERRALPGLQLGLLASLCYPTCDVAQLLLITQFLVVLFHWGDRSPVSTPAAFDHVWLRLSRSLPPYWQARFQRHLAAYRAAAVLVARDNANAVVPDLESYISLRQDSSGVKMLFDLTEYAEDLRISDAVFKMPVLGQLRSNACNIVAWSYVCVCIPHAAHSPALTWDPQDIAAYARKHASGDTHNLIVVLMAERRLPLQGAMQAAGTLVKETVATFLENERFLSDSSADVRRYIQGLRDVIVGSTYWLYETDRFFGDSGDEVRELGWVFLPPS
ncbi:uncharacterized protein FIBRA_00867 [Fibroporia radiculosa]|uniref:Uncharacterized protein n=1 Tax=Fibroporia radiculosa TaxID=599839 RepID=J4GIT0_9APHY|nr:uncharacterized protein FIBRA_00867 [Fibroporia radiculosa]CCL98860.1 predicted protein [Fibroporia radiculosa]